MKTIENLSELTFVAMIEVNYIKIMILRLLESKTIIIYVIITNLINYI
ncbi:MAG: hypothetical protein KGZ71_11915 [Desulfobulbaceae bacterium]|nr:hypothetical protein [Desulfobulbaceae bacterium]MCX7737434.1 hypothetical protein [Candidatus Kapabacteria bacterium]